MRPLEIAHDGRGWTADTADFHDVQSRFIPKNKTDCVEISVSDKTMPLDARGLPEGYALRAGWEVTPRQVRAMREAGEAVTLLDCRTPAEHATAAIDGATLVPLQEAQAHTAELAAIRDRKVVVFCHLGVRSLRMAAYLRQLGFADVVSMAGGIDLWSRDIDASVPRY